MVQGSATKGFGEWLADNQCSSKVIVYYDHGDKELHPKNVAAIKGFISSDDIKEVRNINRLADVDVMVANEKNEILLLIEIEERFSSPKKILGDLFAILLCNKFAVKYMDQQQLFYPTNKTKLIVSGVLPGKGHRIKKVNEVLEPRIREIQFPSETFQFQNIKLVFEKNEESLIQRLKEEAIKTIEKSK